MKFSVIVNEIENVDNVKTDLEKIGYTLSNEAEGLGFFIAEADSFEVLKYEGIKAELIPSKKTLGFDNYIKESKIL